MPKIVSRRDDIYCFEFKGGSSLYTVQEMFNQFTEVGRGHPNERKLLYSLVAEVPHLIKEIGELRNKLERINGKVL